MQDDAEESDLQSQLQFLVKKTKFSDTFHGGASWFYWIAGFSLINSVMFLVGAQWAFFIGLGIPQLVIVFASAIGQELGSNLELTLKVVALIIDLSAVSLFALLGFFAHKRNKGVYIFGMILYSLDALVFLALLDWISLGFHAFALFRMLAGLRVLDQLNTLEQSHATQP